MLRWQRLTPLQAIKRTDSKMKMATLRLAALCFMFGSQVAAAQTSPPAPADDLATDKSTLSQANGLLMLDYTKLGLKGGGSFDLLGFHYLHQLNDWLYLGVGISGPLVEGDYGGFFTVDTTLHAKKRVFDNWFVDAGLSFGGGGGGASIRNIKELSGSGRYTKTYLGLGYETNGMYFGVNYAKEPAIFRKGTFIYRARVRSSRGCDPRTGAPVFSDKFVLTQMHGDVISNPFWDENPHILDE